MAALCLTEGATDDKSLCEPASLDWPGNACAVGFLWPSVYRKAVAITLPGFEGGSARESGPCGRMRDIYHIELEGCPVLEVLYKAGRTIVVCILSLPGKIEVPLCFCSPPKTGHRIRRIGGHGADSVDRCGRCQWLRRKRLESCQGH